MGDSNRKESLLDYLAEQTECMYLSDLSAPFKLRCLSSVLPDIPPTAFSLADWCEAVEYITRGRQSFQEEASAKNYLIQYVLDQVLRDFDHYL
ncbi:hypothetical protein [Anaerolentibacter hominis]|uniref:hypothetical protein n=1 Tax=Anaerolentibacter hominis TaxID=3079009 RepID=UPI0031B898EA